MKADQRVMPIRTHICTKKYLNQSFGEDETGEMLQDIAKRTETGYTSQRRNRTDQFQNGLSFTVATDASHLWHCPI